MTGDEGLERYRRWWYRKELRHSAYPGKAGEVGFRPRWVRDPTLLLG